MGRSKGKTYKRGKRREGLILSLGKEKMYARKNTIQGMKKVTGRNFNNGRKKMVWTADRREKRLILKRDSVVIP